MKLKFSLLCIVLTGFLVACGGGGGDDGDNSPTDQSTITGSIDETTKELAVATKETSAQIMASESDIADVSLPTTSRAFYSLGDILKNALTVSSNKQIKTPEGSNPLAQPLGAYEGSGSKSGECGGSIDYSYVLSYTGVGSYPITYDYDYTLNSYCISLAGYEIVYDGVCSLDIVYTTENNGKTTYVYDLSYTSTYPGIASGSRYYAETCSLRDGVETCSTGVYESETTTYNTSDVSISGDSASGYDISYALTDSDGNSYLVEFTALTLCDDGNIGSGSGSVTYNNDEVVSIEFISCDEFIVTYNGNTETYIQ